MVIAGNGSTFNSIAGDTLQPGPFSEYEEMKDEA